MPLKTSATMLSRMVCVWFLVIVGISIVSDAAKLPNYIIPCKRTAIDLNECAKRNGQEAIPHLVQGDKAYKIPKLNPLKLNHLDLSATGNLKINIKNANIYGLEDAQIKSTRMNLNSQHIQFVAYLPHINVIGEYDVKGRILILPIQGKGSANITLVGGTFTYDMDFDLENKKGEEYLNISKSKIDYETKRVYYQLDNLFNGDKRLGDEMNNFLNENWKEVSKDIAPAITETISQIINQILKNILKKVPYDSIFLK